MSKKRRPRKCQAKKCVSKFHFGVFRVNRRQLVHFDGRPQCLLPKLLNKMRSSRIIALLCLFIQNSQQKVLPVNDEDVQTLQDLVDPGYEHIEGVKEKRCNEANPFNLVGSIQRPKLSLPLVLKRRDLALKKSACDACRATFCSQLPNCDRCQKMCKDNEPEQKAPILESRANFEVGGLSENQDRYYSVGAVGPGPRQDLIARLLNIPKHAKLDRLIILAKNRSNRKPEDVHPVIIDTAHVFTPNDGNAPQLDPELHNVGPNGDDLESLTKELNKELDVAIETKKKLRGDSHLTTDEIDKIIQHATQQIVHQESNLQEKNDNQENVGAKQKDADVKDDKEVVGCSNSESDEYYREAGHENDGRTREAAEDNKGEEEEESAELMYLPPNIYRNEVDDANDAVVGVPQLETSNKAEEEILESKNKSKKKKKKGKGFYRENEEDVNLEARHHKSSEEGLEEQNKDSKQGQDIENQTSKVEEKNNKIEGVTEKATEEEESTTLSKDGGILQTKLKFKKKKKGKVYSVDGYKGYSGNGYSYGGGYYRENESDDNQRPAYQSAPQYYPPVQQYQPPYYPAGPNQYYQPPNNQYQPMNNQYQPAQNQYQGYMPNYPGGTNMYQPANNVYSPAKVGYQQEAPRYQMEQPSNYQMAKQELYQPEMIHMPPQDAPPAPISQNQYAPNYETPNEVNNRYETEESNEIKPIEMDDNLPVYAKISEPEEEEEDGDDYMVGSVANATMHEEELATTERSQNDEQVPSNWSKNYDTLKQWLQDNSDNHDKLKAELPEFLKTLEKKEEKIDQQIEKVGAIQEGPADNNETVGCSNESSEERLMYLKPLHGNDYRSAKGGKNSLLEGLEKILHPEKKGAARKNKVEDPLDDIAQYNKHGSVREMEDNLKKLLHPKSRKDSSVEDRNPALTHLIKDLEKMRQNLPTLPPLHLGKHHHHPKHLPVKEEYQEEVTPDDGIYGGTFEDDRKTFMENNNNFVDDGERGFDQQGFEEMPPGNLPRQFVPNHGNFRDFQPEMKNRNSNFGGFRDMNSNFFERPDFVGAPHYHQNLAHFGKMVPADLPELNIHNRDVSEQVGEEKKAKKMYFVGDGIKLPLHMKEHDDGSLHLSVDVHKLCKCNSTHCQHNHGDFLGVKKIQDGKKNVVKRSPKFDIYSNQNIKENEVDLDTTTEIGESYEKKEGVFQNVLSWLEKLAVQDLKEV